MAEHAREIAISARVVAGEQKHALGRGRGLVRAEAHPGQPDLAAHIRLVHQEICDADPAAVLRDEVHRGLLGAGLPLARDLGERLAGERL